ncbi:MAG: hypothetical protein LBD74_00865 [Spirochaetaceae bacterium]|jgi:hypothetical protein|nr:hypothetical protein [Spirochaetaceae bacterium]
MKNGKQITRMVCIFLALSAGGFLSAENRNPWGGPHPRPAVQGQSVRVTGTLGVLDGRIALQDAANVYYVLGLERFTGFIEGLKEGATVTLEGYSRPTRSPGVRFLQATKLTLNKRVYELVPPVPHRSTEGPTLFFPHTPNPEPSRDEEASRSRRGGWEPSR